LNTINERFDFLTESQKVIITTEKDAVRLLKFKDLLNNIPLYVLPISVHFLFDQENEFNELVQNYPHAFYDSPNLSRDVE
jgi:tetraacyldisaccharide 4'-kinase